MCAAVNRGKYATPGGSAMWEYIATASCASLSFCGGSTLGWTAPSLIKLMDTDSPIRLPPSDASTLASMIFLGTLMAPFLIIPLNRFGRKICLCAAGVPMIIGFGLIIATENTSVLFFARFITGFTPGFSMSFVPMYLGEISSPRHRGSLGIVCAAAMNSGILFMIILVPYFSVRIMACICSSIATVSTLSTWLIPESPYYLVMKDKIEEAEEVLEKLRGKTDVTEDLELIKKSVRCKVKAPVGNEEEPAERETRGNISAFRKLFTVHGNRKALIINLLFVLAVHLCGYVAIMVYGYIILKAMRSGISVDTCMVIASVMKASCTMVAGFVIDKLGRRPLVLISGMVTGICLLIVGVYFYLMKYTDFDVTPYRLVGPYTLLAMVIAINIGIVPVTAVILSETLDADVKALATFVIVVCTGVMATISVKFYLLFAVVWDFGHCVPFFIYSGFTFICITLIMKMLPETKGRTLLQIQKDLNK